jgi:hypothetical protein
VFKILEQYKKELLNGEISINRIKELTGLDIYTIRKAAKKWLNEENKEGGNYNGKKENNSNGF